jgi:hypothetical protein
MPGNDRTYSNSQVPAVMRAWAFVAMSCHARHLMPPLLEAPALVVPTRYRKPLVKQRGARERLGLGGKRQSRLTGGEILSVHDYRDEGVC